VLLGEVLEVFAVQDSLVVDRRVGLVAETLDLLFGVVELQFLQSGRLARQLNDLVQGQLAGLGLQCSALTGFFGVVFDTHHVV